MTQQLSTVILVSADEAIRDSFRAALRIDASIEIATLASSVLDLGDFAGLEGAALVVLDIDGQKREHLLQLQKIMIWMRSQTQVVVLTDAFDEAVGRWFLQIRVSDFLRKPVRPEELRAVCLRALHGSMGESGGGRIITFLPAAGGVGNTTLAVETAIQTVKSSGRLARSTCLVDLDFTSDSCAEYLDLEPLLDFAELGPDGERLDSQLMEAMTTHHASGLALVAAPARPCEPHPCSPQLVERLLDTVSGCFQNVVIDLPRYWTSWSDAVLAGSDRIFVVTDMTVPGLRAAQRAVQRISNRIEGAAPRVIVNRATRNFLFGRGLRKSDVERALHGMLAGSVSNDYDLVREAIDRGVPLCDVKDGNRLSADLRRIIFADAS